MNHRFSPTLPLFALLTVLPLVGACRQVEPAAELAVADGTFRPGERWPDASGQHINAHGGGVLHEDGVYYWFGEQRAESASEGSAVYFSTNLRDWTGLGLALAPVDDDPIILFSYFTGNGETGVYLQRSDDGFTFEPINGGRPVFTPPESWPEDQRLTRDPSIIYHDGKFHMVWTTNWSGRVFGYASSPDLRTWNDAAMVRPFPEELLESQQPKNVWAPEIHYDPVEDDYFIVFSSAIPAMLEEDAEGRDTHGNNHRMYITRTGDFETFTDAEVLYDPGFSSIDGQMVYDAYGRPGVEDDRWIMVFKHERLPEYGGKNIRAVFRDPVTGGFSDYGAPIVGPGSGLNENWAEGPSLLKGQDGMWNLYWDAYGDGYYGLARSPDRKAWVDATDSLRIDIDHPRHGTFFTAPASAVGWTEAR